MLQSQFLNGETVSSIEEWIQYHETDYQAVQERLRNVRNKVLHGKLKAAAGVLRKAFQFAVLSIQTQKDRHERAFTAFHAGDKSLKDASLMTVYGGQKYGWMNTTLNSIDWESYVMALRAHIRKNRYAELLDTTVQKMKGVSHRKASFMLAMSGLTEYMCIDTNVAQYAGMEKSIEFNNSEEYFEKCQDIVRKTGIEGLNPFLVQWAIYDFERGEHSRHMAFFREVLEK